jgi:hypothetical protein
MSEQTFLGASEYLKPINSTNAMQESLDEIILILGNKGFLIIMYSCLFHDISNTL